MSPDDFWRIGHMLDAIRAALGFVEGRGRPDLDDDRMLQFALVRAVEIVGEAASRISPEGRACVQDVPWVDVVGMRNRLVHAHFDINRNILWKTVTSSLPSLQGALQGYLDKTSTTLPPAAVHSGR
jgi:uncharacterized protein with HEPN domain